MASTSTAAPTPAPNTPAPTGAKPTPAPATAKPSTAPKDDNTAGDAPEGGDGGDGSSSETEVQRRARLNREFAALGRKQRELAHQEKQSKEMAAKLQADSEAFAKKQSEWSQQQEEMRRKGAKAWLEHGGFTYDQATQEALNAAGAQGTAPGLSELKRIMEERFEKQNAEISEREQRVVEYQNKLQYQADLGLVARHRESNKDKYALLNHFADDPDENIDDQIRSYMLGVQQREGALPPWDEALNTLEEKLLEREVAWVEKRLASPKIAARIGWKPPQIEQPGSDAGNPAEPHEQQTSEPARGTKTNKPRTQQGRKPRADLPADPDKRWAALKAERMQRGATRRR